ncbi:protein kinase [Myxococcaceae bacterium GXIMD 01537]
MRAPSDALLLEPGTNLGGYAVKARLGQGGFGTVYLVEQEGMPYAAKLLPLEGLGPWAERELLVLTKVRHDNAARLLGHFHYPAKAPRYFVVIMGYVEGRRLDVWTRTENPSAGLVARLTLDVARALAAVHGARALHRDLKESNIIVRDTDGAAVLVDFGVGCDEEVSRLTGGALPPGTRAYLSPEAWRFHRDNAGKPGAHYTSTPADDMYALGVTLYWLLTDVRPFEVEPSASIEAVLSRAPEAPHVRNPAVPRELGELCLRLLAKRPEARPDASALCVELEALLAHHGSAWGEPLCEYPEDHNATTLPEPGADAMARWLSRKKQAEARPRRGVPPPLWVRAEEERPDEAPREQPPARRAGSAVGWVGLALALGMLTHHGGGAPIVPPPSRAVVEARGPSADGKVAPPGKLPEVTAPLPENEAPLKTPTPKKTAIATLRKAAAVASTCATLGCAGTPPIVRSEPEPEPCPPGAVEAMKKLGIRVGDSGSASFIFGDENVRLFTVTEGMVNVRYGRGLGDLRGTRFSGRLIFGERVYGRLTRAISFDGKLNIPVCLEIWDPEGGRGLIHLRPPGPTKAHVLSDFYLHAVEAFE